MNRASRCRQANFVVHSLAGEGTLKSGPNSLFVSVGEHVSDVLPDDVVRQAKNGRIGRGRENVTIPLVKDDQSYAGTGGDNVEAGRIVLDRLVFT